MEELKSCPFCGGKPTYDTDGSGWWVICMSCGVHTARTYTSGEKGKGLVTEQWNRRTEPGRKIGKWIRVPANSCIPVYMCTACGQRDNRMYDSDSFCPNCGADMRGESDG